MMHQVRQRVAMSFFLYIEEVERAQFNLATPTYATVAYYRVIYKQNPFNIISRGVQGCTSMDFRLE